MGDWCLIESDPGVFTELVEKIGVKGVKFDEVYDLDGIPKDSYGLIFLFKCAKREQRETVVYPPSGLFFAKQVITNACATQAILSVLLNAPKVKDLGKELTDFKAFTQSFDPQMRGLAISNQDTIREVHNSFSRQTSFDFVHDEKDEKDDAFHFVGYVPYNGKVYELDGLQDGPIEIGPIRDGEDWLATVKPEIQQRMDKYQSEGDGSVTSSGEIRFNLLSIAEDPAYDTELEILKNRHLRQRVNIKLVSFGEEIYLDDEVDDDDAPDGVLSFEELPEDVEELKKMAAEASSTIETLQETIAEHLQKKEKWKVENARRRHDYVPFVLCALKHLAKQGKLVSAYQQGKEAAQAEYDKKQAEKSAGKEAAKAA